MCEREKIAKEIEKTSESIYKKHRALKIGRIEEDMALDRHFKPIIKTLRQIIHSPGIRTIKIELHYNDVASVLEKMKEKREEREGGGGRGG